MVVLSCSGLLEFQNFLQNENWTISDRDMPVFVKKCAYLSQKMSHFQYVKTLEILTTPFKRLPLLAEATLTGIYGMTFFLPHTEIIFK